MHPKKFQASILAVTMIVLGIMILTALSLSIVTIKDRKASMGESHSGQAFMNAQSGIELVMVAITKGGKDKVKELRFSGAGTCKSTGLITNDTIGYSVQLQDETGTKIDCDKDVAISKIASIKSIGTEQGEQRAIEAAVAASGCVWKSIKVANFTLSNAMTIDDFFKNPTGICRYKVKEDFASTIPKGTYYGNLFKNLCGTGTDCGWGCETAMGNTSNIYMTVTGAYAYDDARANRITVRYDGDGVEYLSCP